MKTFALLTVSLLVAACGGRFEGGLDGGNDGDATVDAPHPSDARPTIDAVGPPKPVCTPMKTTTTVFSDGSCSSIATWTCGANYYEVHCDCPGDSCVCAEPNGKLGGGMTVNNAPNMCPGCGGDLAAVCNFPH